MKDQLISLETSNLVKKQINKFAYNDVTLSLLQKYLRETYGLSVEVNFNLYVCENMNGWYWRIIYTNQNVKLFSDLTDIFTKACYIGNNANMKDMFTPFSTYEESLEEGLQAALKLITKH